ncbi:RNA-binding protein Cwf29 [Exophiala xenobiotica]|nr:RNA-binding protein Cwf29 [Exophiala xenobiotica]KAK5219819.1 RNA-binding protein Cwf29 [Exophiala xenobiotica]KAK5251896.1 RNA-binding protein Cwf29 [Exophiala xenobiotica]KAK5346840.1 RNA-binding protein Cwf29 [Exophiala xenobiotica]KAK5372006.1 RNA-binding protein Cwf29 [Exophiala xenobiotica]
MNAIRQTQLLNKRELENAIPPSASWHADYRDTAYIYIGGLNENLTEGDVVTIFSQFGNPTHLNMIRDKETGKSRGFCFLKYEDQRSCDLAVDNFTGAEVLGRLLRVDHTRYKKRDDEDEDTHRIDRLEQEAEAAQLNGNGKRESNDTEDEETQSKHSRKKRRPLLKEEQELEEMLAIKQDGEEEDPMREYLIREKREELERAKERARRKEKAERKHKHSHKEGEDGDEERRHKHRRREDEDTREDNGRHRPRRREEDDDRAEKRHRHGGVDEDRDRGHRQKHRTEGDKEPRRHRTEDAQQDDWKTRRREDDDSRRDRHRDYRDRPDDSREQKSSRDRR